MIRARLATPDESKPFLRDGYQTTVMVLEERPFHVDMEINRELRKFQPIGHACLSEAHGEIFGHDFEVASEDAHAASVLWDFARKVVLEKGYSRVAIHFEESTPERIKQFWLRLGAKKVCEVYHFELN